MLEYILLSSGRAIFKTRINSADADTDLPDVTHSVDSADLANSDFNP